MSQIKTIKVLVVDDSDVILYSLKNFFKEYNFDVVTCRDGLEGIQRAIEYKPDLILLDLVMPNVDGIKMLKVIKLIDLLNKIPVIVISANTNKSNVMAVIEAGADRVISKPLKKEIIVKAINELLGKDMILEAKKEGHFTESETTEMVHQLRTFFIKSFNQKKKYILNGLQTRNDDLIRAVVHEIKGSGGSIRFPMLTNVSEEVEKLLSKNVLDWDLIESKCNQIFSLVEELKTTHY
ncbi:response regulator [Melioribacteraceae bacterium 4301-Me]|uniref:response regulator n=1 Tax=Pyranulibacter aquaticus TaxID=3163344 RepID=UPI003596E165